LICVGDWCIFTNSHSGIILLSLSEVLKGDGIKGVF
jgi:hypothetical protein